MAAIHTTLVLLYSSVAGMCRKDACPIWLAVISAVLSSDKKHPLSIQPINPVVVRQLKVAVDPSVALTDEVEKNTAVFHRNKYIASTKNTCTHFEVF